MTTMRLLVVDDEPKVTGLLRRALERDGYKIDVAVNGKEALVMARTGDYDAIVLDVMIPEPDGITVCRRLRKEGDWTPVLLLTARGTVEDRVFGLDAGADDYLAKPFSVNELGARIRAITRRVEAAEGDVLKVGDIELDPEGHRVVRGDEEIALTPKEFDLLELFMRNCGDVLTRSKILDHVWDFAYGGDSNVVDVYVRYLREKIDRPFGTDSIETIRGVGYRLRA
jgi:two-component system OmpR family response regulator